MMVKFCLYYAYFVLPLEVNKVVQKQAWIWYCKSQSKIHGWLKGISKLVGTTPFDGFLVVYNMRLYFQ